MKFVWNDEMQEALGAMCFLAHKQRVDITITFTHDGDVEVKAEPTYWDRDTADAPQTETQMKTQNSNLTFDTPQTESTGSPIGDYRDGVGAWQTDRMTEEEIDTMLAKALVGQTDCGWK